MENNDLEDKYKKFWLDRNKEEIIEAYFDSIKNSEVLLKRIIKACDYIKENACYSDEKCCDDLNYDECDELLKILRGEDDRSN